MILNALRALTPGHKFGHQTMPATQLRLYARTTSEWRTALDRLREIADALDDAAEAAAVGLISEANLIIARPNCRT